MKLLNAFLILIVLAIAANVRAQTFEVEHRHLLRSCKGKLVFGGTEVEYATSHKEHARKWKYEDIQQLAISASRISILTFNSRKVEFGADQTFDFRILSGKPDDAIRTAIEKKLTRPVDSSIVPEQTQARFIIPARHRMMFSSSQGVLEFGDEYLVYRSEEKDASRVWRYNDLLSMGSTGPFQLRIGALQKTGGEYGEEKDYLFDLKQQLKPEEYDFIWEKINRRRIVGK